MSDIEALIADTHKFESRYIKKLAVTITNKAGITVYRSPINASGSINAPLLTLQGDEDKVVPPSQSRDIVEAIKPKGIPCAYIEFPGEQHGFRKKQSIKRALEAELSFYLQLFELEHPDTIEPVSIEHLVLST